MGMFSRNPKIKKTDEPNFQLLPGADLESGEGGPNPFSAELAQYRLTHIQGSIDLARSAYDPNSWDEGQLTFDLETSLAHAHQELRDRLQIYVRNEIQEASNELFSAANEVGNLQTELLEADRDYLNSMELERAAIEELKDEPQEIVRLSNLRSQVTQSAKLAIAALFVASEFLITGFVFNNAINVDIKNVGYFLAIGVMVMMIAVPHFLAQGIKEGITKHHVFNLEENELSDKERMRKRRHAHREEKDDKGFKLISAVIAIALIALMVPLSMLRASDMAVGNKHVWFISFFCIQLLISGYFFLREWLDHGGPSTNLHRLQKNRKDAQRNWRKIFSDYSNALDDYFKEAQPMFKAMLDFMRLDNSIKETYLATLHAGRALQEQTRPELAPFIHSARIPYLGLQSEISDERGQNYDPISNSNRAVEDNGTLSREWLAQYFERALGNYENHSSYTNAAGKSVERTPAGFLIDGPGSDWLYSYLKEKFGLDRYEVPKILDASN